MAASMSGPLLEVTGLNVVYYADGGALPVLRDVELALERSRDRRDRR